METLSLTLALLLLAVVVFALYWRFFLRLWLASRGIFDVRLYGAKGDGETDDTDAIQRAIDDACAYVAKHNTGAIVQFLPGIFRILRTIFVRENTVYLVGAGGGCDMFVPYGTALVPDQDFAGQWVLAFDWSEKDKSLYGNRLKGIAIMIAKDKPLLSEVGGLYWGVAKGWVEDVYIDQMSGLGLGIQGYSSSYKAYENRFIGVTSRRCTDGLQHLGSASDNWFDHCQFHGHRHAGLNGLGANNYYFMCHWTGNLYNVIADAGGTEEVFIGCNFETPRRDNLRFDVSEGSISRVRLIGCQLNSNALEADDSYDTIYIGRSKGSATVGAIIQGNTFTVTQDSGSDQNNRPRHHINLSGPAAQGVVIEANTFGGSVREPIHHDPKAERCLVNGLGQNGAVTPTEAGPWHGYGVEGNRVFVEGETEADFRIYEFAGGSWR